MSGFNYEKDANGVVTVTMDMDGPVNSMSEAFLPALRETVEKLEAEIGKIEGLLADPELFTREPVKFRKATEMLTERQAALASAEEEWLVLAEKAEG